MRGCSRASTPRGPARTERERSNGRRSARGRDDGLAGPAGEARRRNHRNPGESTVTSDRLKLGFVVFHVTLGAVVLWQSVRTILHAMGDSEFHLLALAALEALGAVLFLVPKTLKAGAIVMLASFAIG